MSVRKIVIYPKSAMKPIVITDTDDTPIQDIEKGTLVKTFKNGYTQFKQHRCWLFKRCG